MISLQLLHAYTLHKFAILLWPYLENMGYTHVMRMDDDSYIHSKIEYNIFDHMRTHGRRYGFRQPVRDSAVGKGYDAVGVCDLRPLIAIVVFCIYLAWSNSVLFV